MGNTFFALNYHESITRVSTLAEQRARTENPWQGDLSLEMGRIAFAEGIYQRAALKFGTQHLDESQQSNVGEFRAASTYVGLSYQTDWDVVKLNLSANYFAARMF